MIRPLKDIVAELEEKYKDCKPLYDLEERRRVIADFDHDMEYVLAWLNRYEENVKFVLERRLNVNIIVRMTMNLVLVMHHLCCSTRDFVFAIELYLVDKRYEKSRDYWSAFVDIRQRLQNLFDNLRDNKVFEVEKPNNSEVFRRVFEDIEIKDEDEIFSEIEMFRFHPEEVERLNGEELLVCLNNLFRMFEDTINVVIDSEYDWYSNQMESIYERNYLLYAKAYWPAIEHGFRPRIMKERIRGDLNTNMLEKLDDEVIHNFAYNTESGRIWRDHSDNPSEMALQMKEQKLNEEQWKYFYQRLFEHEEFIRWIDELRNPPEAKIKAAKLTSNKDFMAIMAKAVEQGFCHQDGWQYKWGVKVEAVYFASVASHKFNLSNRHDRDRDLTISWKPFECLFDDKGFRSVYNDYQNGKYKLPNKDIIDKLLK